jgi:hypothetical protein
MEKDQQGADDPEFNNWLRKKKKKIQGASY